MNQHLFLFFASLGFFFFTLESFGQRYDVTDENIVVSNSEAGNVYEIGSIREEKSKVIFLYVGNIYANPTLDLSVLEQLISSKFDNKKVVFKNSQYALLREITVQPLKDSKEVEVFAGKTRLGVMRLERDSFKLAIKDKAIANNYESYYQKIQKEIKKLGYKECPISVFTDNMHIEKLEEAIILKAQRQKLQRFYSNVFKALEKPNDLDEIEGVYTVTNSQSEDDFDIVIICNKSTLEEGIDYLGFVWKQGNSGLDVGECIYHINKTAIPNKFLVNYSLSFSSQIKNFKNQLTSIESGIVTLGEETYVKRYPSENEEGTGWLKQEKKVEWLVTGSGVLLNQSGFIATNFHVVRDAKKIIVDITGPDGEIRNYNAQIVAKDSENDVAILKLDSFSSEYTLKNLNVRSGLELGERVFALGFPLSSKMGTNVKLIDGIVSGKSDNINSKFVQTTMPFWWGNSGGACFDENGNLFGLATQIEIDNGVKVENVGYVLRLEYLTDLIKENDIPITFSEAQDVKKELSLLVSDLASRAVFVKVF